MIVTQKTLMTPHEAWCTWIPMVHMNSNGYVYMCVSPDIIEIMVASSLYVRCGVAWALLCDSWMRLAVHFI